MANVYKIMNKGANKCLNVYGSNVTSLKAHQNVTIWEDSGTDEQKWTIDQFFFTPIRSVINSSYGLNVYRTGSPYNCDLYPVSGNETDSTVEVTPLTATFYGKIKLQNYDLYLTAASTANGANVYWGAESDSDLQSWKLINISTDEEEDDDSESGSESGSGSDSGSSSDGDSTATATISMPHNLNQKYSGFSTSIHNSGSGICCACDLAVFYGGTTYTLSQLRDTYNVFKVSDVTCVWENVPCVSFSEDITTNFLPTIKAEIDAGHPVLVKLSNKGSATEIHWVVAYGYKNSAATTYDVYVLDPAGTDDGAVGALRTIGEAFGANGMTRMSALKKTSRRKNPLIMPQNLNQKYKGYIGTDNYDIIYKYGCCVCCVADVASYYAGKKYSVGDMFRAGVYTSDDATAIYSNAPSAKFVPNTCSSEAEYLNVIKSEIDQNKPVMVEMSGTYVKNGELVSFTHWVVAYGYTDNCSSIANCLVLDPYNGDETNIEGRKITLSSAMSTQENCGTDGQSWISSIVKTSSKS